MFSIDGIVSGFDTTSIIESLLGFQQAQVDTFNSRKAEITTQQSAFKGIETQLLTFRNTLGRLNRSAGSVFDVKTASSSNEDIIQAAASSGASSGVYNLTVNSLATAHQIGSQNFTSSSDELGTGTISFKVGDRPETVLTLDENNNTVSGLVNAINEQVDDVNAGIIYDQGADSYRILLTSQHTGEDNEIAVTSNLAGIGAVPDFSGDPVQQATNATITLGSGAGAITASYATNQVEDLIEDVTLDLKEADASKTVTISINSDTEPAKEAIGEFVDQFNSIMEFIDNQTRFNPETNEASPLLGNRSVSQIQNRLRGFAIGAIPGLDVNRLANIGIDIDTRGRLSLDSAKLDKALNGDIDGVDPKDIRNLFGLNGSSTNSGIEFLTGGKRTVDSETPYEVNITQAAEKAQITAANSLASSIVITDANDEFQITVDGTVSETLTLSQGTYTQEEFAAQVESIINNSSELGVRNVSVGLSAGNELVITSDSYGSKSNVSSVSGEALATLGFSGTENEVGKDVAGSFIVNGVTEVATGSGRILIGDSDNENTADLQLRVTLGSDQVNTSGVDGEVLVTRGVSGRLDQYLNDILDADSGTVKTINDDFDARIQSIDNSIERVEELTASKREFLIAEFTALETIISELQTTGNFLSSQLNSIGGNSQNK